LRVQAGAPAGNDVMQSPKIKESTMKLLHIDSSILGDNSVSRQLTAKLAARIERENPGLEKTYLDLAADPIPHLSAALFAAQALPAEARTAEQARDAAISELALESFLAADTVIVGAPMYNFSISSQLKAWIDRIAVAGKTFRYTENGPEGLAGGKKLIIVTARGGLYGEGTPLEAIDHQERYLRAVFSFLGVTDIEYVRAEGLALGDEQRRQAIGTAEAQIAGQPLAA